MVKSISKEELEQQRHIMEQVRAGHGGRTPRACVITLGCVQNENDSERSARHADGDGLCDDGGLEGRGRGGV